MKKLILLTLLLPTLTFAQWTQLGTTINGQAATEQSGTSTSLNADGTVLAIGAPNAFDDTIRKGRVRIFEWNGTSWSQKGSDLIGSNQGDTFGESVSISSDGNIVAIGAPGELNPVSTPGYTRIFEWNGTSWIQKGTDIIGEGNGDSFGGQVSLNANGTILAIGASFNNGANGTFSGHCRIYEWNGTTWSQKGADIDGEGEGDLFGNSVSINNAGTVVAIGGQNNSAAGNLYGHVRIFEWNGTSWIQKGTDIEGDAISTQFGLSVAIDGAGSSFIASSSTSTEIGSVKCYTWNGTNWEQKGQTIFGDGAIDLLGGIGLDINEDGSTFIAGARFGINGEGYAKVFKFLSNTWEQEGLNIFGQASDDQFGRSASISSDGSIVAIGTPFNSGSLSNAGLVRVFENAALSTSEFDTSAISFYPNPSKDFIHISSQNIIEQITIYNLLGQEVISKLNNSQEFLIDISYLPNGTYIAKLNVNERSLTNRIIKL